MRAPILLAAALISALACGVTRRPYHAGQVRKDRHRIWVDPPPTFFQTCSRATVFPVHGTFPLTDAEVATFEGRLPAFLELNKINPPQSLDHYFFAYAGVLSKGRRLLYASAAPDSLLGDGISSDQIYGTDACDGGPDFWSIVFDLDRLQFRDPTFNVDGVARTTSTQPSRSSFASR